MEAKLGDFVVNKTLIRDLLNQAAEQGMTRGYDSRIDPGKLADNAVVSEATRVIPRWFWDALRELVLRARELGTELK